MKVNPVEESRTGTCDECNTSRENGDVGKVLRHRAEQAIPSNCTVIYLFRNAGGQLSEPWQGGHYRV